MKILVTGGAGFIGSTLIKRLKNEGNNIVSLDDYSTGTKENEIEGVKYINADIEQIEYIKGKDIDLCFLKCKRNVKAVIDSEKIKSGIAIPPTPVPRASEPEPETIPLP